MRAPERYQVDEIYARILKIAEGAELMTGTQHEIDFITGCYNYLPYKTLSGLIYKNMLQAQAPSFSTQERAFAKELQASFLGGAIEADFKCVIKAGSGDINAEKMEAPLWETILPHAKESPNSGGSTEVGDVSWITPTGQLTTICWPFGTPAHSWQTVAASGSFIGMEGMLFTARSLALTALDLITDPQLLTSAHEDFASSTCGKNYQSSLSPESKPQ